MLRLSKRGKISIPLGACCLNTLYHSDDDDTHENNVKEKVYHLYSYEATMRMCGGNPSIGVWNQKQTLFPVCGDQVTRALSSLSWHHAASLTTLTGARASVWHLHNFSAVPILFTILFTGNYSTGHQLVVWKTRKFHILVKLSRC